MSNRLNTLSSLTRPKLLLHAARLAVQDYQRQSALLRILGETVTADDPDVFTQLFQHENELNDKRKSGDATYSVARHVLALTALIGEAQVANQ
jgi:hypothetical protein